MKETSDEALRAIERTNAALAEAEDVHATYDAWMAEWRKRNGYVNGFDPVTGLPLRENAE